MREALARLLGAWRAARSRDDNAAQEATRRRVRATHRGLLTELALATLRARGESLAGGEREARASELLERI